MAKGKHFNNSILVNSYAKINLSLDVLGKRPNGYHDLCMIMQTVSLHDDIRIISTMNPGEIQIHCSTNKYVPCNEKNIAHKAAKKIFERYLPETAGYGVIIKITKRIPVAAGLAGGSGNAAAVIKAMNQLFNLNMSAERMCELGLELGADVPYCIHGGTMLSEGIGEILTPLTSFPQSTFLLVNPNKPLSTAAIFSNITNIEKLPHPDTKKLIKMLNDGDAESFIKNTANSLEAPAIKTMPQIQKIKNTLMDNGASGAMMSGSGPTVFALFKNETAARKAAECFSNRSYKCFISHIVK